MDEIAANAARIVGVAAEYFKGITVKAVEPVLGAKPEKAFFILQAADNRIVGQPVFYLEMPEIIELAAAVMGGKQQEGEYAGSGSQITAVIKVLNGCGMPWPKIPGKCILVEAMANR